jgi:hypothetical protein
MTDRVFYCPGCRQQYADSRLPERGQLFDCPRCHLLFIPADKDFAGGVGLREHESAWADEGMGRAPKAPFSEAIRRRLKRFKPHDLLIVWVTGIAMLVIAWIIFVIAHSAREIKQISPPIAQSEIGRAGNVSERGDPPAPAVDAPDSPPTPVRAPKSMPAESATSIDDKSLLGDWESVEQPLEGVTAGEVFAITLGSRGAATMQARSVLQVETITGQWRLAGSILTLRFGEVGQVRDVAVNFEKVDGDTIRLTTLGRPTAEFKRKKN